MTETHPTTEQITKFLPLDFEQRQRAVVLEDVVNDDAYATASELVYLRDIVATISDMLRPMTHPETKQPIGFHMCFVRDADIETLQKIAKTGVVRSGK